MLSHKFAHRVIDEFVRFHATRHGWGNLHFILEDGNTTDVHVEWVIEVARATKDTELERLAWMLLAMSEHRRLMLLTAIEDEQSHRELLARPMILAGPKVMRDVRFPD